MTIKKLFSYFIIALSLCQYQSALAASHSLSNSELQKIIFTEINAYRTKQGLSPLLLNNTLTQEAIAHSLDMAEDKVSFSHQGYKQRMERLFAQFQQASNFAENVAYTHDGALALVQQWIESSRHRQNIEGNFNLTGIGVARGSQGRIYATQIFLRTE